MFNLPILKYPQIFIYLTIAILVSAIHADAQFAEPPVPIVISASWTLEKNQADASFASSVAKAGDVNGDGYSDVLVGAPYYDHGEINEGAVFLYYGSEFGLEATPDWWNEGNQAEALFGYSISSAGDVNNDGYADVIIGCPYYDNVETDEGKVFVYLGSAAGLSTIADWTFESNQVSAQLGKEVSNAGDITGDNFDDIIVGSPYYDSDDAETNAGMIFLFEGNAEALYDTASWKHNEYYSGTGFGTVMASAGDVNGDGFGDIIVGARYWGWDAPGLVMAFYGSATGLPSVKSWSDSNGEEEYFGTDVTSGDLNGDGYTDVIVSGPGNADAGGLDVYVYYGGPTALSTSFAWAIGTDADPWEGDNLGSALATADVNGDGFDDLLIGSHTYDKGQIDEGVLFMYSGGPEGVPGTTAWVAQSNQAYAHLGSSIASAGDVNGDGYDDFIGGAPDYDNGQTDEGQARVYLGSAGCIDPPVVTLDFTDLVCLNDGVITLTEGTPPGGTYSGTGVIGTDQFDTHLAGIGSHTISYVYIDAGGCSATASDILTVEENPPASLTLGGASLNLCISNPVVLVANTGTGLTYQWYRNGVPLTGEIYLALLAYTTGNYQVEVTNTSGCSKLSKKKKVTHTGCKMENEEITNSFLIYPNPNSGQFNLQVNNQGLADGNVTAVIYNLAGHLMFSGELTSRNGILSEELKIQAGPGFYVLHLIQDGIYLTSGFIVQ